MDFTVADEQRLLVDSVTSLLARACPPAVVRAVTEGDRDAARLPALADYVALGDAPAVDHVLVAERLGSACAPGPWLVASAVALPLLRAAGQPRADAIAAGERAATVAWAGADGRWSLPPAGGPERTFVLELDLADDVVVVHADGISVMPGAGGRRTTWLDLTRTAWEVAVDDVATHPVSDSDLAAVLDRATVVLAAELCGTARAMLDRSLAFANERVQFNRPIGSFQAVQHLLADLALDVERAWAVVQWAAMCLDEPMAAGSDAARAPHIAKAAASEAGYHAARTSIQVHGGIGYTWEHDLHLWLRRATTTAHLLGTADEHHDALASLVVSGGRRG
ncbi:MAG: acyl-CoA dehydrogenase family protein [Acidimicrobiales bacterium]